MKYWIGIALFCLLACENSPKSDKTTLAPKQQIQQKLAELESIQKRMANKKAEIGQLIGYFRKGTDTLKAEISQIRQADTLLTFEQAKLQPRIKHNLMLFKVQQSEKG